MSVADKYMFQSRNRNFRFTPPEFNMNLFKNNNLMRDENSLNLFPSETAGEELYCYYNALNGCKNNIESNMRSSEEDEDNKIIVKIPSPTELLRKYNFELVENTERGEVESIYCDICKNHHNIIDSLTEYKMPVPIAKLITKSIVRLSLQYSKECNKI